MPRVPGHPHERALQLELEPSPDAPAEARAAIAEFAETHGIDTNTLATIILLVSELVTNAVVHPEPQVTADIRMHARLTGPMIRVEITDQGSGFTPRPRDSSQMSGGYGLYLLNKAATKWGVEPSHGTTVWFEIPARAI